MATDQRSSTTKAAHAIGPESVQAKTRRAYVDGRNVGLEAAARVVEVSTVIGASLPPGYSRDLARTIRSLRTHG